MKTLIIAVNAKFIHSNMAIHHLAGLVDDAHTAEYTINENQEYVLSDIFRQKPHIAAFSCYIWNRDYVFKLAENLKKIMPKIVIVLGGPEVSFTAEEILENYKYVDYVVSSEGEVSFSELVKALRNGETPDIPGVYPCGKTDGNEVHVTVDPNGMPNPYTDIYLDQFDKNRILYYESSRGCPFSCTYCLSQNYNRLRYLSMDRVKRDLKGFMDRGIPLVKFVDRTFNVNPGRAREIILFILQNNRETRFHFEVSGDLFDREMLLLLKGAPKGMFQLEVGIQSTNKTTLEKVNRKTDLERVFATVKQLVSFGNIHVHVDLIAGLPCEDLESFKKSFNETYELKAHHLQLGFLKLLKGTSIREEAKIYGYIYREYPPYEVLANNYISFEELSLLKGIETVLERYYNSGRFYHTLNYVMKNLYTSPFEFFEKLYRFNEKLSHIRTSVSAANQFNILYDFFKDNLDENDLLNTENLMKLDYFISNLGRKPPQSLFKKREKGFNELINQLYREFEYDKKTSHVEGFNVDVSSLINHGYDRSFGRREEILLLFDYRKKDKVCNNFPFIRLK